MGQFLGPETDRMGERYFISGGEEAQMSNIRKKTWNNGYYIIVCCTLKLSTGTGKFMDIVQGVWYWVLGMSLNFDWKIFPKI